MRTARKAKFALMVTVTVLIGGTALALAATSAPKVVRHPADVGEPLANLMTRTTLATAPLNIPIYGFQFASSAARPKNGVRHPTITLEKTLDGYSATLFYWLHKNTELGDSVLTTTNGGTTETITCKNGVITKWNQNVNQNEDLETFDLECEQISVETEAATT